MKKGFGLVPLGCGLPYFKSELFRSDLTIIGKRKLSKLYFHALGRFLTAVVKNGNNMREKRLSSKGDSDWVVAGIVLGVIQILLFVVYYFETDFDLTDFSSKPSSKRLETFYCI